MVNLIHDVQATEGLQNSPKADVLVEKTVLALIEALRPSRTPLQGVGARHARSKASPRGSAPASRP